MAVARYTLGVRQRDRVRRAVKWGWAILTGALLAAWIGTVWWDHTWCVSGISLRGAFVTVSSGRLDVGRTDDFVWPLSDPPSGYVAIAPEPVGFKWWFHWHDDSTARYLGIPLWALAAILLAVTILAWRRDGRVGRQRPPLCIKCGYDRTGIGATSRCPECGEAASAPS